MAVAARGKGLGYVTPEYWTTVTMTKCKITSPTTEHCEADITFAGYTLKQPESDKYRVPTYKIHVK